MKNGTLNSVQRTITDYLPFFPERINDGKTLDRSYTWLNSYMLTSDSLVENNIGYGVHLIFNRQITPKQFRISAYVNPVTQYGIDAFINGSWVRVCTYNVSPTDSDNYPDYFGGWISINFNFDGKYQSNQWRIYLTGFDSAVNSNYYAYELEIYEEVSAMGVLMIYQNSEWIAPYTDLRYENGVWIRDGGGIVWENGEWIDWV